MDSTLRYLIVQQSLIGTFIVLGYFVNAGFARRTEKFKLKTEAYANFLRALEDLLPATEGKVVVDNEMIRRLNRRFAILAMYTPDHVIQSINDIANLDSQLNRSNIKSVLKILHNDLHHPNWYEFIKSVKVGLSEKDIPHFPFSSSK